MKKQTLLLLTLCLHGILLVGQNVLLNPSFEDTLFCPGEINSFNDRPGEIDLITGAKHWKSTSTNADYYNCDFYEGWNGASQAAYEGTGLMGLSTYKCGYPEFREVIQGELTVPLEIGETYDVSMMVKPTDKCGFVSDNIGLLFITQDYGLYVVDFPIPNRAHVNAKSIVSDTENWTRIEGSFVADSAFRYVLVGNLFEDAQTDTMSILPNACSSTFTDYSYYFIDDICVHKIGTSCDVTVSLEEKERQQISVYPNPVENTLYIKGDKGFARIYDISGREIMTTELNDPVQVTDWGKGLYYVRVIYADGDSYVSTFVKN